MSTTAGWTRVQRIAFRVGFVYFWLYMPSTMSVFPVIDRLAGVHEALWFRIVVWVGHTVLHREISVEGLPNGSGDTLFHYVRIGCYGALALAAAAIWSLRDEPRRVRAYPRLYDVLRVGVRYVLMAAMVSYGVLKVFKLQFPFPPLIRLTERFGDQSPMGLLWAFMGYSAPYTIWAGLLETIGGLLLVFRRTTTLGALVVFGVMANVAMLNFSYDVPVKLFSSHLCLMATLLLATDARRLFAFFVLNRPVEAVSDVSFLAADAAGWRRGLWRASRVAKVLFVGACLHQATAESLAGRRQFGDAAPRSPLYGIYEVEEYVRGGVVVPPLVTDMVRWRTMLFDYPGRLAIRGMDGSLHRYSLALDPQRHTLEFIVPKEEPGNTRYVKALTMPKAEDRIRYTLGYSQPDPDHLVLSGMAGSATLQVHLRRVDPASLLLVSRGFRWVNDVPFNR